MSEAAKWPREIWLAELDDNHNGTGMVVLSEFATVARWEGDDERDCDFQKYVDSDIHDSAERYWKTRIAALEAENARMREALQPFRAALSIARAALGASADRGHIEAVALRYVSLNVLRSARAALSGEEYHG